MRTRRRSVLIGAMCCVLLCAAAAPGGAQTKYGPLFDKFNLQVEGSWVGITTEIRLDSEVLGRGTTLNFENDLGLAADKTVPTLAFQWQIAKRHRLGARWQNIDRSSSAQALTEIQWGDEIIPIDADITLGFDITQTFIDYAYYPWVKDRWGAGFGLGFRWMDIQATLTYRGEVEDDVVEGSRDVKGSAPLPYIYFEYRRLFSDAWRFTTGFGWLYIKFGDIEGGQWLGRAQIEYLTDKRWGFGASINIAQAGVDWIAIATEEMDILDARIDLDVNDFSVFLRVRF